MPKLSANLTKLAKLLQKLSTPRPELPNDHAALAKLAPEERRLARVHRSRLMERGSFRA